jgi:hypothetical protein
MSDQFMKMEVKGIAKDAHEKFPIKFDIGQSGVAYFTGCKVETTETTESGVTITKRIDVQAFREVAEELAGVYDGAEIYVKGDFVLRPDKDKKNWYPTLNITEVVSVG